MSQGPMLLSLFLTCVIALAITTLLLLLVGHRVRIASRAIGVVLVLGVAYASGLLVTFLFGLPTSSVLAGEIVIALVGLGVVAALPRWNPIGQLFYGTLLASAASYLAFGAWYTVAGGLSGIAAVGSGLLFVLEALALT